MRSAGRGASARHDSLAEKLARLRQDDAEAALALSIDTIGRERAHRVLEPSLDILSQAVPLPDDRIRALARDALRTRFIDLTENGVRFDQDCDLRVRIVKLLREVATPEDRDIAERGVRTIQLQPPARIDVAQALRGQSLLLLDRFDQKRSGFYAVEFIHDLHVSRFNGEPAVTAIQLLAARGEVLAIWAIARRPDLQSDVLAQAFASLRQAPTDLQTEALVDHLDRALTEGPCDEATALVAGEAIILNGLSAAYPRAIALLSETTNPHLFLYLATAAARSPDRDLRAQLAGLRTRLTNPEKQAILRDLPRG